MLTHTHRASFLSSRFVPRLPRYVYGETIHFFSQGIFSTHTRWEFLKGHSRTKGLEVWVKCTRFDILRRLSRSKSMHFIGGFSRQNTQFSTQFERVRYKNAGAENASWKGKKIEWKKFSFLRSQKFAPKTIFTSFSFFKRRKPLDLSSSVVFICVFCTSVHSLTSFFLSMHRTSHFSPGQVMKSFLCSGKITSRNHGAKIYNSGQDILSISISLFRCVFSAPDYMPHKDVVLTSFLAKEKKRIRNKIWMFVNFEMFHISKSFYKFVNEHLGIFSCEFFKRKSISPYKMICLKIWFDKKSACFPEPFGFYFAKKTVSNLGFP